MSLLGRIGKFAKSPQGKKLMQQAQQVAKDPKTKEKIAEARGRFTGKSGKPAADPASATPKPANPPAGGAAGGPPPGASS